MDYVSTDNAPKAFGPFCQATVAGGLVFTSGLMPLDATTGSLVPGGMKEQTRRTMENMKAVLEAAGASLRSVMQVVIYITDMAEFDTMNQVYGSFFDDHFPARVTVGVASLAKGAGIEMQAIALVEQ